MIATKIAAAYIRVSDERQDEYSPDSQLKKVREYAEREGYYVPDEYVFYDDGISARTAKKRTEFNRMISIAKEKTPPFEAIIVWKFSRFARNREESMVFKNLLRKRGIKVLSVSEPIPDDHYGTLLEGIIEWYDEFYSINLGVEVRRGMTEKVTRGEPICPPAYGYIIKDKRYYPDWESGAAQNIQEIFRQYNEGESIRAIARWLNRMGAKTRYGGKWEQRGVEYVLYNPLYIGKLRFSADGTRLVSRRKFDDSNVMIIDGHHEPIISLEVWECAQARLAEMRARHQRHEKTTAPIDYMLKGLIKCSNCGSSMTLAGTSGKTKKRLIQCCGYNHSRCDVSHCILYETLEESFLRGLEQAVQDLSFRIDPPDPEPSQSTTDYDKIIALERRRLDRAKEAYLDGVDSLEQYKETKASIEATIAEIEAERDEQKQTEPADTEQYASRVVTLIGFLRDESVDVELKNIALKTIIDKVVYEKAKQNVAIYFKDL